ncbi:MAG: dihydroorotase family protein [Nitrospinota bacterium]
MPTNKLDTAILNGTVVSPTGRFAVNVGIRDGRIAVLSTGRLAAKRRIDAGGKLLLPGLIDPHGHMQSCWENGEAFRHETRRKVLGGVTTYLDYASGPRGPLESMERWKPHIEAHSYVDMGIQPIINGKGALSEIEDLLELHGVSSFKFFFSGLERELYPTIFSLNDGVLVRAFEIVAALGPPTRAVVHAENWEIGWFLEDEFRGQGRMDGAVWTDAHPHICEEEGIARACFYAEKTGCPLYIVHIGVGAGPRILADARRKGVDVIGETCPHYLLVNRDDRRIALAKYNPAIKWETDREALWLAVGGNGIDCLGSDHIASTGMEEQFTNKEKDIWAARSGLPGSGTILFTLLDGVQRKRLSLERLVALSSYNPARAFGLFPRKGHIGVGADADIVILDPDRVFTFRNRDFLLHVSLLEGMRIRGRPERVLLRGETVVENGRVVAGEPGGEYLERRHTPGR